MRIEDVAPSYAEHLQGSRKNAEVVEILGGVDQDLHQLPSRCIPGAVLLPNVLRNSHRQQGRPAQPHTRGLRHRQSGVRPPHERPLEVGPPDVTLGSTSNRRPPGVEHLSNLPEEGGLIGHLVHHPEGKHEVERAVELEARGIRLVRGECGRSGAPVPRCATPASISGWRSTAVTRPDGPASLARGMVKYPMPQPMSRQASPGRTNSRRILSGSCASRRSGLSKLRMNHQGHSGESSMKHIAGPRSATQSSIGSAP